MNNLKTIGLYKEGFNMPRIEFRIMIGDEDVTEEYDLSKKMFGLLKGLHIVCMMNPKCPCNDCRKEKVKMD